MKPTDILQIVQELCSSYETANVEMLDKIANELSGATKMDNIDFELLSLLIPKEDMETFKKLCQAVFSPSPDKKDASLCDHCIRKVIEMKACECKHS